MGNFEPLVINIDGTVLAGNQRLRVHKEQGDTEVEVSVPERELTDLDDRDRVVKALCLYARAGEPVDYKRIYRDFHVPERETRELLSSFRPVIAVKMSLLIDETAKTDAGFEIIKTIAKNTKLNEAWQAVDPYRDWETDRKSTRLNSSHSAKSRMPSSA